MGRKMKSRIILFLIVFTLSGCQSNVIRDIWGVDEESEDVGFLLAEGKYYLEAEDYDNAYIYYNRALTIDPTSSEARYGITKTRIARQIDFSFLVHMAEKISGVDERQADGDPINGMPLITPQDFNFDTTYAGRFSYYLFCKQNFMDLHQIIWGISDGVIPSDDVGLNIDCAVLGLLTGLIIVWRENPEINAYWDDSLKKYTINLSSQTIMPSSPYLADTEEYLNWAYLSSDRAYNFSDAHSKSYMRKFRDIIWSLLNTVRFYRSL